jgi:hypothetical protein
LPLIPRLTTAPVKLPAAVNVPLRVMLADQGGTLAEAKPQQSSQTIRVQRIMLERH